MKKRMISLIGLCLMMLTLSSCGLRSASPVTPVELTPTPTPEPDLQVTPAPAQGELLEMQASPESEYKNIVGNNTAGALSFVVENRLGVPVADFYLRQTPEDEDDMEWGTELIGNSFRLDNGDKMLCYFTKSSSSANRYDLRVNLANEDEEELYFRYLPLESISRVTLRLDGTGYSALPYATYAGTSGSSKEVSTLEEVKRRVGISDDEDTDYSAEEEETETEENNETFDEPEEEEEMIEDTGEEEVREAEEEVDPGIIEGDSNASTAEMDTARSYIGQSVEDLEGAIGMSNSVDYVDEPELGETGYHYYNSYTVMTSVDENGNEIVVSIW